MEHDARANAEIREGALRDEPRAVETVRGWIAAMVYGAGWALEDPEAVIQEVTFRILHLGRTGKIRTDTDFKSFVLTVARHECTDVYRRERLRTTVEARAGGGAGAGTRREPPPAAGEERAARAPEVHLPGAAGGVPAPVALALPRRPVGDRGGRPAGHHRRQRSRPGPPVSREGQAHPPGLSARRPRRGFGR
jgi:hypothetical protein